MDEEIRKNLKKAVEHTEMTLARSILRWKYKKEGKPVPLDNILENKSRQVAGHAHQVMAARGKNAWKELKKVYFKGNRVKEGSGE